MIQLDYAFVFQRIQIIDLEKRFEIKVAYLHQRIVKGAEHVEYLFSGFILGKKNPYL